MDAECSHCAGEVETVAHFLMRCPAYERERRLYLHRRGRRPESIAELLTTPEAFKRVIRSVDATKRLGAIFGDEPNLRESLCSRHCPKWGGGGAHIRGVLLKLGGAQLIQVRRDPNDMCQLVVGWKPDRIRPDFVLFVV